MDTNGKLEVVSEPKLMQPRRLRSGRFPFVYKLCFFSFDESYRRLKSVVFVKMQSHIVLMWVLLSPFSL